MAMPKNFPTILFPIALVLVFLSGLSLNVLAQNTVAECGPSLLPLTPCAPYVQGMSASPAQSCCHSVDQLYFQKHTCLCLLLHDPTLMSSFPVNWTLALQLPLVCNLQIDISTCAGTTSSFSLPLSPSQMELVKPNSSLVEASPKTGCTGFGLRNRSGEVRLKAKRRMLMLVLLVTAISVASTRYVEI